jgi:hypothetical protein
VGLCGQSGMGGVYVGTGGKAKRRGPPQSKEARFGGPQNTYHSPTPLHLPAAPKQLCVGRSLTC